MLPFYARALERMSLRVVAQPTTEPVTLDEARLHLRLEAYDSPPFHADDAWIEAMIPAAREYCEIYAGRSFAPQTFELAFDQFPQWSSVSYSTPMRLPMAPIRSLASVTYTDVDGTHTVDDTTYVIDTGGQIYPAYGTLWPTLTALPSNVRIRYTAGFDSAGDSPQAYPLPARYRAALLLMLGHLYENREATAAGYQNIVELPLGVQSLLSIDQARIGFA